VISLARYLKHSEWKEAWKWSPRTFNVKLGDKIANLYNVDDKLLTSSPFTLRLDELNMKEFAVQSIHKLTNHPIKDIRKEYSKLYRTKEKLWEVYRIPVELPEKKFTWIRVRKKASFNATPRPNKLGFYYAEINTPMNVKFRMLNDNVVNLLYDLFFVLECFIGHEEIPYTFSQGWYMDYKIYGDRRYSESIARYNVEQSYYNYIFERIKEVFMQTTKKKDKATFLHIIDLFRKLSDENKYYIMQTIIDDDHFEITEDEYVVYYPLPIAKYVIG